MGFKCNCNFQVMTNFRRTVHISPAHGKGAGLSFYELDLLCFADR